MVVAVNLAVTRLPEVGSEPVQPPVAVQEVALVDDQVKVVLLPLATEVAAALKVTVGTAGETVTAAVCEAAPPAPVQDRI